MHLPSGQFSGGGVFGEGGFVYRLGTPGASGLGTSIPDMSSPGAGGGPLSGSEV